jgi:5-methylcytosine-specific restriction protein A
MPTTNPYHCSPWKTIRLKILHRDGHVCQIRGPGCKVHATHVDHVIPWSEGGPWFDPGNLRAACSTCNVVARNRRLAAMARLNRQPAPRPSPEW